MFGACRQKRTGHCVVPGGNWEYCCIYFLLDYIHLLGIPYYLVRCSAELSSTAAPLRQQSLDRRWQHGSDSSVHAVLLQSWSMQLFTMERIVDTFCPQTLELSLLILSHVEHSVRNWKIWRTFTLCCCLKFENGKRLEALIQNFFLFFFLIQATFLIVFVWLWIFFWFCFPFLSLQLVYFHHALIGSPNSETMKQLYRILCLPSSHD